MIKKIWKKKSEKKKKDWKKSQKRWRKKKKKKIKKIQKKKEFLLIHLLSSTQKEIKGGMPKSFIEIEKKKLTEKAKKNIEYNQSLK